MTAKPVDERLCGERVLGESRPYLGLDAGWANHNDHGHGDTEVDGHLTRRYILARHRVTNDPRIYSLAGVSVHNRRKIIAELARDHAVTTHDTLDSVETHLGGTIG